MTTRTREKYVNLSAEDEKPKEIQYGVWVPQKYLSARENLRVASGISVSVAHLGGNNYEVNLVGNRREIIADSMEEAKNQAKNLLRDMLAAALEFTK